LRSTALPLNVKLELRAITNNHLNPFLFPFGAPGDSLQNRCCAARQKRHEWIAISVKII
jgi:hypothetical protein